ncbi:MAG TPA: hypothetical protein VEJ63_21910 [Planctomycetota bacterium]|nr:hypothetical protein [Planctomycetota bacterium]
MLIEIAGWTAVILFIGGLFYFIFAVDKKVRAAVHAAAADLHLRRSDAAEDLGYSSAETFVGTIEQVPVRITLGYISGHKGAPLMRLQIDAGNETKKSRADPAALQAQVDELHQHAQQYGGSASAAGVGVSVVLGGGIWITPSVLKETVRKSVTAVHILHHAARP